MAALGIHFEGGEEDDAVTERLAVSHTPHLREGRHLTDTSRPPLPTPQRRCGVTSWMDL